MSLLVLADGNIPTYNASKKCPNNINPNSSKKIIGLIVRIDLNNPNKDAPWQQDNRGSRSTQTGSDMNGSDLALPLHACMLLRALVFFFLSWEIVGQFTSLTCP